MPSLERGNTGRSKVKFCVFWGGMGQELIWGIFKTFIRHPGGYVDYVFECESRTKGDINSVALSV